MTISIVTRKDWDARPPRDEYVPLSGTKGVKIHYTGGYVDPRLVSDHGRCLALMRQIQNHHMDVNGWADFAYSYAACWHRKVLLGRGPGILVAANGKGLNSAHYAVIGLVGDSGLTAPNDDMLHAILDAVQLLRERGGAGNEIKGHRDGYNTDCPGTPLYDWVRRGAPRPGSLPTKKPGKSAPAFPGRLLRYPPSMHGADVYVWQSQMRDRGWNLIPDGTYGPRSKEVCVAFQTECIAEGVGIGAVDGIVGERTWRASWEKPVT
ncbi:peptidoglycan recognition protein family protein [Nonomuraea soli]|uniref:Peptidoglycan recognition protein family domain-containing protein n=1 Tax=Nonomuraea soli TaxID=1032476 RepID=A0A7W0CUD2_9ACTN|nr:peptidoglycan-binding domain-containing protein [Nonomuraea soli]MBA2897405.1 hypothetical protein [Nonomuraea soli]